MDWKEYLVKQHTLYMAVTQDRYELPIAVADSMAELARIIGVDISAVTRSINKPIRNKKRRKYVKVILSEEEYEEATT